jgi:FkbM family methyltransferase
VDCSKLRSYKFWNKFQSGKWEPSTFKIFDRFCDKDHSYIDIGAYIGPTVLYGCQLARHCFAIEPDPIAFQELKNNIELNEHIKSRITLSKYCISSHIGTIKLFTSEENVENAGGSSSTILDNGYKNFWEVQTTTLQQFIQDFHITDCNFIKIDTEGAEFDIIPNALDYLKNQKPTLLIELHPMFVKEFFKNWNIMCKTLSVYDHMYNADLKEIDENYIHSVNLAKQFHVVWTDL